jgi:catechol 2,3-dioxygenase-like lactoylglutathione lyase family enzyme
MPDESIDLAHTIEAMRPMVPAKDFELSKRFYTELGFRPATLIEGRLAEMRLAEHAFLLQNYYVKQWADNAVIHLSVSSLSLWWAHVCDLDLPSRYGSKIWAPQQEDWALVASLTDPSGVLWRIAETPAPKLD